MTTVEKAKCWDELTHRVAWTEEEPGSPGWFMERLKLAIREELTFIEYQVQEEQEGTDNANG